jgi:hypothetical protein
VDLNSKGPLLYPIYEALCGQVVAYAEETLTAEAVDAVHGRLLQLPADSPVVVIERLARDYAGKLWNGAARAAMRSTSATASTFAKPVASPFYLSAPCCHGAVASPARHTTNRRITIMFSWYREITSRERKTFWACFGGWSLDALEVQMFGLAIPALIAAFSPEGRCRPDQWPDPGDLGNRRLAGWHTVRPLWSRAYPAMDDSLVLLLHLPFGVRHRLLPVAVRQGHARLWHRWRAAGAGLMAETINPKYRQGHGHGAECLGRGVGLAVALFTDLLTGAAGVCLAGDVLRRSAAIAADHLGTPQRA